jgi:hypothetical protein
MKRSSTTTGSKARGRQPWIPLPPLCLPEKRTQIGFLGTHIIMRNWLNQLHRPIQKWPSGSGGFGPVHGKAPRSISGEAALLCWQAVIRAWIRWKWTIYVRCEEWWSGTFTSMIERLGASNRCERGLVVPFYCYLIYICFAIVTSVSSKNWEFLF